MTATKITANHLVWAGPKALFFLRAWLSTHAPKQVLFVTDTNTHRDCLPLLQPYWDHLPDLPDFSDVPVVILDAGEPNKNLEACVRIWEVLTRESFGRDGLLINVGGGMVGDIGGFAAATYKRGIRFLQIPTSLLAMVDASVGGKTGVNFQHFKNQIGAFYEPELVIADPIFLQTLPAREIRSGYAEMLKHSLIADAESWTQLSALPGLPAAWDAHLPRSIAIKAAIVIEDPREHGPRKALNFGHTVGHALESHLLELGPDRRMLHGEAVAAGMICEAWLSLRHGLLSQTEYDSISTCILRIFGRHTLQAKELPEIAHLATQDKKNVDGQIMCTLLDGIGNFRVNVTITTEDILLSLQHYSNL
ncbi:MAG: 3-dehydroquinate synthase [Bacteroidota bacterium]